MSWLLVRLWPSRTIRAAPSARRRNSSLLTRRNKGVVGPLGLSSSLVDRLTASPASSVASPVAAVRIRDQTRRRTQVQVRQPHPATPAVAAPWVPDRY